MALFFKNSATGLLLLSLVSLTPCLVCKNKKKHLQSIVQTQMPSAQSIARTVTVKPQITEKQLEVHYCGTHLPDTFSLAIQENENQQKELFSYDHKKKKACNSDPVQVALQGNRITVDYSYSFAWGAYKATKRVHFELPSGAQTLQVSFSFTEDQRVLIPQAQFVGPIESVS